VLGCFLVAGRARHDWDGTPTLTRPWMMLGTLLMLLGINQQLDLQTLMIQAGRELASAQGWYEHRRLVQKIFFGAFALALTASTVVLVFQWRGFLIKNRWVTMGLMVLLGFILMRAASINHLQADSLEAASEESWEDFVELIGLLLIIGGLGRAWGGERNARSKDTGAGGK